jgi:hypothetical protein
LNLSDYATQIQLTEGTILVRVRRLDRDETFEIDTPNLAFSIYQAGTYKVSVNEAGDVTDVQVRRGEGEVTGGGAAYSLYEGDDGRFAGTDGLEVEMSSYRYRPDAFESWSALRDRRIDHSYSSKYVSPDVIGYEDLDENGGWRPTGEYGNVWFPHTTEPGWAPYHNGHWAYIAPWGYTWVDDEPWGFAPFHYGRWVNVDGAWGWVPGPRESDRADYIRPVYAPALVAWVGGAHFAIGVSVSGGGGYSEGENVGWFPLGPREVYVPSYPVSRTYVNNVNVSNTTVTNTVVNNYYNTTVVNNTNNSTNVNVTNVKYVNQTVPGAVTATTSRAFVSAQPVARNFVQVNQREVAAAPVRIAAPPVAPARQALLGATAQASAKPPEAVVNRTVVAKAPPPPPPVPIARQQQAIQANGGKPLAGSEIRQMRVQEQQQVQRGQQQQQQQRPQPGQTAQTPQQAQAAHPPAVRIAPPAQPQNVRPGQAQGNAANRPAAAPNNPQEQNNRPANQNAQQPPQQGNRPGQPVTAAPNQTTNPNAPNNQANRPPNANNPPPATRPPTPDPALEQKHQQELEQLHKQQDQERQRLEQQHQQEQKLQEQKAAEQQRQLQQQQAQTKAEQDRKLQEQKAAEQQREQQQQQAQTKAEQDRKLQEQKAAEQQRQQQQQQQQQQAQRNAEQQRQLLEQKHQEELRQLEQKHAQEQQQLNQKHEQEHQQQDRTQPPPQQRPPQQQPPPPPPKKDKPKPKPDRPPQ